MEKIIEFLFGTGNVVQGWAWLAPAIITAASAAASWFGQRKQNKENRKLAEYQNSANKEYLNEQLEYNTPKNQMSRWQDASLNPNLIYGQGNPGSQSSPLQYPDIKPADYQRISEAIPLFNQTSLAQSQVQAQNARTRQLGVMAELNKVQKAVLEKNPLLDEVGFGAIIDSLKATAESKTAGAAVDTMKAEWFRGDRSFKVDGKEMHGPAGALKMETELKMLLQKFDLGTADQKVKAEIIKSKEFNNEILEIQKRFMTDGEITNQHIIQFIQLLLMKML